MSFNPLRPRNEGIYNALELPTYNSRQSFVGSYMSKRDVMFVHEIGDLYGAGDLRLVGKREIPHADPDGANKKKWLGLLEVLTLGEHVAENLEPIMAQVFNRRLGEIDREIASWEKFQLKNGLARTSENRDVMRATWLAGEYVMKNPIFRAVTEAPSRRDNANELRSKGIGYVADLAGFSIQAVAGDADVQAVVTGRDFERGRLPRPNIDALAGHSAVLMELQFPPSDGSTA